MDTQSLQAFLAVAETQSFSRAAEQLYLTQPAVSKRIATLESQVGARLFDRIGRRIALTEAGNVLLPQARHILFTVEDSRRALANLSGQVGGKLTLATSHHIGLHRLPPLLKQYTQRHPEVELDLHFLDSELAYQGVLDGTLEMAVVTLAPTLMSSYRLLNFGATGSVLPARTTTRWPPKPPLLKACCRWQIYATTTVSCREQKPSQDRLSQSVLAKLACNYR
ncbi:hypothetical protein HSBAA_37300 [Vreelandella sulfidaeris]|uniref:HTH lysR-type domain-containing protein n=1 Tax=Vreelandella sulfidaeris TaxID=115553 RepID=A0A455UHJ1_9GAMM|nr:hypothetical protein HSBAA_37300 [Halomonas sulfidaeris]